MLFTLTALVYFLLALCLLQALVILSFIHRSISNKVKPQKKLRLSNKRYKLHVMSTTLRGLHRFLYPTHRIGLDLHNRQYRQQLLSFDISFSVFGSTSLPVLFNHVLHLNQQQNKHLSITSTPKPAISLVSYEDPAVNTTSTAGNTIAAASAQAEAFHVEDDVFSDVDSEVSVDEGFASQVLLAAQLRTRTDQLEKVVKDMKHEFVQMQKKLDQMEVNRDVRINGVEFQERCQQRSLQDSQLEMEKGKEKALDVLQTGQKKIAEELELPIKRQEELEKRGKAPYPDSYYLDMLEGAMLEHRSVTMVRAFKTRNGSVYCAVDIKKGVRISGEKLMRFAASKVGLECLPEAFMYVKGVLCGEDRKALARKVMKPMLGRARVYNKKRNLSVPIPSWFRNIRKYRSYE